MASTGIRRDCTMCGATNIPVKFDFTLYKHGRGAQVCQAEPAGDHFDRMLRNAKLAVTRTDWRLATDEERIAHVAQDQATADQLSKQGELF